MGLLAALTLSIIDVTFREWAKRGDADDVFVALTGLFAKHAEAGQTVPAGPGRRTAKRRKP